MSFGYEANVIVYGYGDEVVAAETAFGETVEECSHKAGVLRDGLESIAMAQGVEDANGFVEEPRRVVRA